MPLFLLSAPGDSPELMLLWAEFVELLRRIKSFRERTRFVSEVNSSIVSYLDNHLDLTYLEGRFMTESSFSPKRILRKAVSPAFFIDCRPYGSSLVSRLFACWIKRLNGNLWCSHSPDWNDQSFPRFSLYVLVIVNDLSWWEQHIDKTWMVGGVGTISIAGGVEEFTGAFSCRWALDFWELVGVSKAGCLLFESDCTLIELLFLDWSTLRLSKEIKLEEWRNTLKKADNLFEVDFRRLEAAAVGWNIRVE